MSTLQSQDLPNNIGEDDIEDGEYVDIAFVPNEHEIFSDDSDSDDEEDISSRPVPPGSYEYVRSLYTSEQKLLEPNHVYDWVNTAYNHECDDDDNGLFDTSPIEHLKFHNSLQLFEHFFSFSIKNYIIEATSENGFDLNITDLNKFITVVMITIINSRKRQKDYWSKQSIISCPVIANIMSRNKFCDIKKNIRFYKAQDHDDDDKVWKIRTLYNLFRENIMKFNFFDYNFSIDEVMVKYFGRLGIKQCIRNKPIRFGIKLWALCSSDGYIYDCDIYTGASGIDLSNPLQKVCLGSRVVIKLLQKLLVTIPSQNLCKYHVYFDNFFTSPDLLIHLKNVGLSATGTVRQNHVKYKLEMPKKSDRGTCLVAHEKNSKLNYITVMDSKPVSILSTGFNDEPKAPMKRWHKQTKKTILFPQAFSKYNSNMGGVDLHDQHCNSLLPTIR